MGLFGKPETKKPGMNPASRRESSSTAGSSSAEAPTVIGLEAFINGEISCAEIVLIEGRVEGKIKSSTLVIIGEAGRVKAEIDADSVSIQGRLEGNCTAKKKVEITRTGKVFGNIRAPIIAVAEGAIFRGASQMAVDDSEATPAKQEARHGEPSQKPKAVSGEAPRLNGVRKN